MLSLCMCNFRGDTGTIHDKYDVFALTEAKSLQVK